MYIYTQKNNRISEIEKPDNTLFLRSFSVRKLFPFLDRRKEKRLVGTVLFRKIDNCHKRFRKFDSNVVTDKNNK